MNTRQLIPSLGFAMLCVATPTHAQQEIKITVSAGHAPVILWVKHIKETLIPTVNRELAKTNNYKIVWNEAYGGTLAKLGSELETIEQGVSDMGWVGTVFHPAKMPLQNVSFVAPFGPTDPRIVIKVINELHEKLPAMRKAWEKHNQVYLTGVPLDDYGIFGIEPINRLEDMNGKKYGGPATVHSWIKGSGAVGVAATLSSYYNDIKSGIYSGTITLASGAVPAKLYEVAPYFSQLGFGAMYGGGVSVNKTRWDKFPPEVKAAFKVGGEEFASAYGKELFVRTVAANDAIRANKGTIVAMPEAERVRLAKTIENPAKAWIETATKAGHPAKDVLKAYMDGVRKEGGKFARDWDRE